MNGFDLDGVVSLGIHPGPDDVIITGRSFEQAKETYAFLHARSIFNAVYFNPINYVDRSREKSGAWKAFILNTIKVDRYFEDDPVQLEIIKQAHPELDIIHIVHNVPILKISEIK